VCYRSNNVAIVGDDNDMNLHRVLHEVSNRFMLLMGDFNYPDIDWASHSVSPSATSGSSEFFKLVEDQFLTQHVLSPTRGDAILDLILTTEPDLISNVSVIQNFGISDHNMVAFTLHLQCQSFRNMKTLRDYSRGDYESVNSVLASINWNEFLDDDTAGCWNRFSSLLHSLEDKFIPVKRIPGQSDHKKPVWMSYKAFKCVRKKRKVFRKYKDINHPAVRSACKTARSELCKSRPNFEDKLGCNIKQDRKSFFAYVRSRTKSKVHVGSIYSNSGNMTTTDTQLVESFNDHFVSVFTAEDSSSIPSATDRSVSSNRSCSDISFTEEDVLNVLMKLRVDKADGPDELSARFLIQVREHIVYPLFTIFRKSLDEGFVPDDWKSANISPVFKKGNRNIADNYQPVSLTSQICKVFETIIRDSVVYYFEDNSLLLNSQHGFRKRRSCVTNLLTFIDKATGCLDSGEPVDTIFLDFAKAFDKVPHRRLALKLSAHGITGKLLQWIVTRLSDRKQRVCVNGRKSSWHLVLSGVPQGSVLGPLLFLIYINDLDDGIINWILKFADDTKIFGRVTSVDQHTQLQDDLNTLLQWSKDWQMLFNIDKCKVMHFGRNNLMMDYTLDNKSLKVVQEEKDLGIVISQDLKASAQCIQAYSKANRMLGVINRSIVFKSASTMLNLYKSVVRPHLEYCTVAWSPHYVKDKELLERAQRRFTRMIPELKDLPYAERLGKLNLWTLEERRVRADLIEVYKIVHRLSAVPLEDLFDIENIGRTRGHSLKLRKKRCRLDLRLYFFSERVVNLWNSLDEQSVTAVSVNSFKCNLERLRRNSMGLFMDSLVR